MRFLKIREVVEQTKLPKTTIYERVQNGTFPKPLKIGLRSSVWIEGEIQAWIHAIAAGKLEEIQSVVSELAAARKSSFREAA